MTAMQAVMRREFRSYFGTPLAYVFLCVFLWAAAFGAFKDQLFEMRDANLRVFFSYLPWLFAFLAPAIAMRTWAEERRTGTVELLLTLPVTVRQAVLGKFFAGWAVFAIALLLTTPIVFSVEYLGDPDYGPIFAGYLGALLMSGAYLAIGTFFSALTKNQVIAFIVAAVVCLILVFLGQPSMIATLDEFPLTSWLAPFVEQMSFAVHFDLLQRGVIELRNIVFPLVVIAAFLICSVVILNEQKAR
ncbi:MAG: ABC transporter permease [Planctomycetes bacterium]|nr:ABC transporter permease [Planctomycetota bacterium]